VPDPGDQCHGHVDDRVLRPGCRADARRGPQHRRRDLGAHLASAQREREHLRLIPVDIERELAKLDSAGCRPFASQSPLAAPESPSAGDVGRPSTPGPFRMLSRSSSPALSVSPFISVGFGADTTDTPTTRRSPKSTNAWASSPPNAGLAKALAAGRDRYSGRGRGRRGREGHHDAGPGGAIGEGHRAPVAHDDVAHDG